MKPQIITGIDIGNSQVKVVVAKISNETLRPEIIGVGTSSSNGLRRGMVFDMEECTENVGEAIQRAQDMAGVQIKRAYLAVSGLHIGTQVSRGVIAVSRADNEISANDIERVLQAASVVSLPPNREVVHVIPRTYIVDGREYVKNPLGMKGVRLEAEVYIVDGLSPYLKNVAKCVNENGIEITERVFAPIASSLAVLDKNQKEYGVLSLDFGGGTSTLTVFEEADLLHTAVLPIGSKHITSDLAIALRTSLDVAEKIKLQHGATSDNEDLRKREIINLSEFTSEDELSMPKKNLVKVVDARTQELLEMVSAEIKKTNRNGMLPAGVVLSGGGSNLPGFASLVKETLRLPVRIGRPANIDGIDLTGSDPAYSVAVGLIIWGFEKEFGNPKQRAGQLINLNKKPGGLMIRKALSWLRNFMP
jgi:cell division protein FtsA